MEKKELLELYYIDLALQTEINRIKTILKELKNKRKYTQFLFINKYIELRSINNSLDDVLPSFIKKKLKPLLMSLLPKNIQNS